MTLNPELTKALSSAFITIPFNKMLGLKLDTLTTEEVVMSFQMNEQLIGNYMHGILHGGVISSVLDMAGGMVVMAHRMHVHADKPRDELEKIIGATSTIDLQISYLRPGRGEQFTCKAWLVKGGSTLSFAKMELYNDADELIATGSGTYHAR